MKNAGPAGMRPFPLACVALVGALTAFSACASSHAGDGSASTAGPSAAEAIDEGAAAADGAGVDEAARAARVRAAEREARRAMAAMEERTRREFLSLFGSDPLGLTRVPENAGRYEIPLEMNRYVRSWLEYFRMEIPERFATYLEREGRYGPLIRARLREAGLPGDLVYKAMVESGLNVRAYSRARAVGMWQFMTGTARKYGLEVSYWVDERRDPVRSTEAAIAYLTDLYAEFGSWYLAAAAYNAGEGRVRWGISRTGSNTYWELVDRRALPRETRNHVPKIIAATIIAHDPERYGFRNLRPESPYEFEEVEVPDATSFDVIAQAAGATEREIQGLNPHYPRKVTPPGRAATVRVPVGHAERFEENYAKIPSSQRVTWLMHTVTRGQTLSHIARRYRTSVAAIRAANPRLRPRRLQIGQRLVVPRLGRRGSSGDARVAANPPEGPTTVVVRRGDTLWSIARRYRVSTRELMRWNELRTSVIRPGDRLKVRR